MFFSKERISQKELTKSISVFLYLNCPVGLVVESAIGERRVLVSIPGSAKSAIGFF